MCRAARLMLLVLTLAPSIARASQPTPPSWHLETAEWHYQSGLDAGTDTDKGRRWFALAAKQYELLRRRFGIENPALFRNLGNAYLLADRLPEAIFSYRRGLQRFGYDRALFENLEAARQLVEYPAGNRGRPASAWPAWLPRPTPTQALWVTIVLYGTTCIAVTRWLMTRRGSWLMLAGGAGLLASVGGGFWVAGEWQRYQESQSPLVVIAAESVPLCKGNGPSYPANEELPTVYRGMEARMLGERGGWLHIEFKSGDIGWVPKGAVLVDEP